MADPQKMSDAELKEGLAALQAETDTRAEAVVVVAAKLKRNVSIKAALNADHCALVKILAPEHSPARKA